jgi:hypothetical protein
MQGVHADMMCLLSARMLRRCIGSTVAFAGSLQDNLDAIACGAPRAPATATPT